MTVTVAYFFYREAPGEESAYAQMWGSSSSPAFQDVYWRTLVVSLVTCRELNPEVELAVYLNEPGLPVVDGVDVAKTFAALGVDVRILSWRRRPPRLLSAWGCQMFQLDVVEDLARRAAEVSVFLDLDTVWLRPADPILDAVASRGLLTYDLQVDADDRSNDLTPREIAHLLRRYHPGFVEEAVTFTGGEFLAAGADAMGRVAAQIDALWVSVYDDMCKGVPTYTREDHFLSAVYATTLGANALGNDFVRRIWTGYHYRDARAEDLDLTVWHLPAEKRLGFARMFRDLGNGHVPRAGTPGYLAYLRETMGVPERSASKLLRDWLAAPGIPKNLAISRIRRALGWQA